MIRLALLAYKGIDKQITYKLNFRNSGIFNSNLI